jgi:hypothetical protein
MLDVPVNISIHGTDYDIIFSGILARGIGICENVRVPELHRI